MFGYTLPEYRRLSPADNYAYRRYYCEGCHQLRDAFGLTGALTVNYDMTFNTVLLSGLEGSNVFEGTTRRICVLERHKSDSELMRMMAAYTLILTKWELFDDETDLPSVKSHLISLILGRAIGKATDMFPEYDRTVGEAFGRLRELELDGSRDALLMGREFGKGLAKPLIDIAGDAYGDDLADVFMHLTSCVYIMDALDDLDEDYMNGTYNPFLPESGYVNARKLIDSEMYRFASVLNEAIGSLQRSYSKVRPMMKGNQTLCDNVVYYGIPESAKMVLTGNAVAKASIKNVMSNRRARTSERSRRIVVGADVKAVTLLVQDLAEPPVPAVAALAAPWAIPPAAGGGGGRPGFGNACPYIPRMPAEPAGAALSVALIHSLYRERFRLYEI